MNIFFRADASTKIGIGHVMRCLTLAGKLRDYGNEITFICRKLDGDLCEYIIEMGYTLLQLPPPEKNAAPSLLTAYSSWLGVPTTVDASQTKALLQGHTVDLLIIDHYAISLDWEQQLRSQAKRIMVIDDLANRRHDCDILVDQNLFDHHQTRYHSLVPARCQLFLGPSYVLLRDEFYKQKPEWQIRGGPVKKIFIFFGGIDQTNETGKALFSFLELRRPDIHVDVVVGQSNRHKQMLKIICDQYPFLHYHCQVANMAELMQQAQLSIGAGGTTTWERCFLGLPSLVWSVADNQQLICETLARRGVIKYLGPKETLHPSSIKKYLNELIEHEQERIEMAHLSMQLMEHNRNHLQTLLKEIMKSGESNGLRHTGINNGG